MVFVKVQYLYIKKITLFYNIFVKLILIAMSQNIDAFARNAIIIFHLKKDFRFNQIKR